jgi:diguanylate cyclase (GGDEF)-like protein
MLADRDAAKRSLWGDSRRRHEREGVVTSAGDGHAEPVLISTVLLRALLSYVNDVVGRGAADSVLADAGISGAPAAESMVTDTQMFRAARSAARLTGDPDMGCRTGEQLLIGNMRQGLDTFIRAEENIEAAFRLVVDFGSNMSANRVTRIVESSSEHVRLVGTYGTVPHDDFFCRLGLGYYARVPSLFGAQGVGAETKCQVRGDDVCEYVIRWRQFTAVTSDAGPASAGSDAIVRVFEDVHLTASELVRANDVAAALDAIVARVGHSVMAPRFVLGVRLGEGESLRLHARNVPDAALDDLARQIEDGTRECTFGEILVAPIEGTRPYGFLAAILAAGMTPTRVEERLLRAYARHAAVIIETAHAFEQARRDRDTSQSLLGLANTLTTARTPAQVASLVASAAPHVVGCGEASVWLRAGDGKWACVAPAPADEDDLLVSAEIAARLANVSTPHNVILRSEDMHPVLQPFLAARGITHTAIAPIVARGDLLGLVGLSWAEPERELDTDDASARLAALADLASGALDNVRLLERTQHQATHDALTGLPNRTRATEIAFEHLRDPAAHTSLLFIDLDDFKTANDRLGHAAGDQLLQLVAERIVRTVRTTDTVTRFAGDEFVVILPVCVSADEAHQVAARIRRALEDPFVVDGSQVRIGASIGVSTAPFDGHEYDTLLHAADVAMYACKAAGRHSTVISV